jgi:thiol-disulfide isomerase/thioredoxin
MKQAINLFIKQGMMFSVLVSGIAFGQIQKEDLQVGDKAPCVVLEQQTASGDGTKGCIRDVLDENHKFTFVEFFSISCSTCAKNLPVLANLASEYAETLTLRQISVDRDVEAVKEFIDTNAELLAGPIAFDNERLATKAYFVKKTPTLFVLNTENQVLYRHQGLLTEEDVDAIKDIVEQEGIDAGDSQ